jgi:flagellar hook protein FlgE
MDVVGNNLANINTTGFKKGRVNFQDLLYQQLNGASRPTEEIGGINPKEVGLGMSIATIDTIHTQGSLQTTGIQTDLAIQGNGFFILQQGDKTYYTRAGAFGVDQEGMLVNPSNGMRVQGWMAQTIEGEQILNVSRDVENINIPVGGKDPARATTRVNFACNLDSRTPILGEDAGAAEIQRATWSTEIKIFDSLGEEHILQVAFTRADNNQWNAAVTVDPGLDAEGNATNPYNTVAGLGEEPGADNQFTVNFSPLGNLLGADDGDGNVSPEAGAVMMGVSFDVQDENGALMPQAFNLNLGTIGGLTNTITQYASSSSTKPTEQDGYAMGYLDNFKIDQSGTITGVFSNGTNRILGQLAMASFTNQGGLEKSGESTYMVSNNSGRADVGPSGIAGKGKIVAGALEMANVDMAEQFTDMIVTQRGFQANSRTIQTADQLLQELLTLKR